MQKNLKLEEKKEKLTTRRLKNIDMTDNTVFKFFKNAYNTMNTSEQTDSPKCPKRHIKAHVISEFHKLIKTKEATIVDR